jgi:hypothetical protein
VTNISLTVYAQFQPSDAGKTSNDKRRQFAARRGFIFKLNTSIG